MACAWNKHIKEWSGWTTDGDRWKHYKSCTSIYGLNRELKELNNCRKDMLSRIKN